MTLTEDEIRIMCAVTKMRLRRIARQRLWIIALWVGLAGSTVHHLVDNLRHRAERACAERP